MCALVNRTTSGADFCRNTLRESQFLNPRGSRYLNSKFMKKISRREKMRMSRIRENSIQKPHHCASERSAVFSFRHLERVTYRFPIDSPVDCAA